MIPELELLETMSLENGLVLSLYNGSKLIADKLWYLSVTGRIEIPITETIFEKADSETIDFKAVKAALGDRLVFEKKMERNYIRDDKKESTLQIIRDYFMDSIVKYLSHPDFSRNYILKCYRDHCKKVRR